MNREPTAFETRIYNAVCRIPEGQVTTYKLLGETIGCRSARAVGQALRRNPFAPEVPCHRVVASDRTIGGFAGDREGPEITKKRKLLQAEGVRFNAEGKIDRNQVIELEPHVDDELAITFGR